MHSYIPKYIQKKITDPFMDQINFFAFIVTFIFFVIKVFIYHQAALENWHILIINFLAFGGILSKFLKHEQLAKNMRYACLIYYVMLQPVMTHFAGGISTIQTLFLIPGIFLTYYITSMRFAIFVAVYHFLALGALYLLFENYHLFVPYYYTQPLTLRFIALAVVLLLTVFIILSLEKRNLLYTKLVRNIEEKSTLERFICTTSHEINNPLTVACFYSKEFKDENPHDERRTELYAAVERIKEVSEKLNALRKKHDQEHESYSQFTEKYKL